MAACCLAWLGVMGTTAAANPLDDARRAWRAGDDSAAIEQLKLALAAGPDAATETTIRYLLGRTLLQQADRAGLSHMEALSAPFGDLEDRRLVWLARGRWLAGNEDAAVAAVDALTTGHPDVPELAELRLKKARLLVQRGQLAGALTEIEGVLDARVNANRKAEALALKADILRPTDREAAAEIEVALLVTLPASDAARELASSAELESLPAGARYRRAVRLVDGWSYREARHELRRLVALRRRPQDSSWLLAEIGLRKLRDAPDEARTALLRIRGRRAEEALYLQMRAFMKEERYGEALKVGAAYDKAYPNGQFAERIAFYRAWLPYDRGDCAKALPAMRAYLKVFRQAKERMKRFRAWCRVRTGSWERAASAWGGLTRAGRDVDNAQALYWRAFALDKAGRREDALKTLELLQKRYPLTFYGVRGQQLLATFEERDPTASKLPWPKGGAAAAADDPLGPSGRAAWGWAKPKGDAKAGYAKVQRDVELLELSRARAEWSRIAAAVERTVPEDRRLAFARFISHQLEDHRRPFRRIAGWRNGGMQGLPDASDERWLLAYPRAYRLLVEGLSERYELPAPYMWSIMRVESHYAPGAISDADAVGALQMIEPTARKVAAEANWTYDGEGFAEPRVGFPYSFFYMKRLARLWHGQLMLASASYNAGPEPIARWLAAHGGDGPGHLVEEFAYGEAKDYARNVATHTLRYLYLYEADPAARAPVLDALFPVTVNATLPAQIGY